MTDRGDLMPGDEVVDAGVVGGALRPGDLVHNTFRIDRVLSMGGMGALYAGHHDVTGEPVAIKVILPSFARDERAVRLFQREALTLKRLSHPAIVGYEAFLRDAEGGLLLVMEYVEGRSLAERLAQGRLAADEVLELGARLVAGLAVAHDSGVAHRDLSPANIMLPNDDVLQAKLIDFGIAKRLKGEESSIIGDSFAGKIRYASPEQLGLFGGEIDGRTDTYSLGLVLAEALGLRLPGTDGLAGAMAVRGKDADLPADIDARLRPRLLAMLRADPADRPQPIDAAWHATTPAQESARSDQPPSTTRRSPRRAFVVAGVILATVLAGGAAGLVWLLPGADTSSGPATVQEILALPASAAVAHASDLLAAGGEQNLDTAFAVLAQLGRDGNGEAAFLVARMYDPRTYDPSTSPFSAANPTQAVRWYERAAGAGVADAARQAAGLRP